MERKAWNEELDCSKARGLRKYLKMAIRLTVKPLGGGKSTELTFDQQRIRIGRGAMCDLRLPHRAVSSVHAMILLDKDR